MLPAGPGSQSGVSSATLGSGLGPPSGGRGCPAMWRLRGVSYGGGPSCRARGQKSAGSPRALGSRSRPACLQRAHAGRDLAPAEGAHRWPLPKPAELLHSLCRATVLSPLLSWTPWPRQRGTCSGAQGTPREAPQVQNPPS